MRSAVTPSRVTEKVSVPAWRAAMVRSFTSIRPVLALCLEHGIRISVNHSGDSDTTGILVGQLLGAQYGESAIPQRWLEPLELRDEIGQIADDLYHHREWNLDDLDYDENIVKRYPGY